MLSYIAPYIVLLCKTKLLTITKGSSIMELTNTPLELIFYPMTEGQGWYLVGVYPPDSISAGKDNYQGSNGEMIRVTLAQLSSQVSIPLAHKWAQSLAEHFGLAGFIVADQ